MGITVGAAAQVARALERVALDLGGCLLGRAQDALHLAARRCCERQLLAIGEAATELLQLGGQRAQMRIHGGGLIAAPDDREVAALDRLAVDVHSANPRLCLRPPRRG